MIVSEDTFSTFRGPSWIDPLSRPLPPEGFGFRDRRLDSSGASCQLVRFVSVFATEVAALINAPSPAGGDRYLGPALPREDGAAAPITVLLCKAFRVAQSGIFAVMPVDNGDIGRN